MVEETLTTDTSCVNSAAALNSYVKGYARRTYASQQSVSLEFDHLEKILKFFPSFRNQESFLEGPSPHHLDDVYREIYFGTVSFCFMNPQTGARLRCRTDANVSGMLAFRRAFCNCGVKWKDFDAVENLSLSDWERALSELEIEEFYLWDTRLQKVRACARSLNRRLSSDPERILDVLESIDELVSLLASTGCFQDNYFKRLQLTVAALNLIRVRNSGVGITGLHLLTCLADYRLPQLLYNFGVINIKDQSLKEKLLRRRTFSADHPQVNQLRAATIIAGEEIASRLGIYEIQADKFLWLLAAQKVKENALPIPGMLVATDQF